MGKEWNIRLRWNRRGCEELDGTVGKMGSWMEHEWIQGVRWNRNRYKSCME